MFPKKNRADKKEITQIFKKGIFINSQNLTLRFFKDIYSKNNTKSVRVSFISPKNVSKSAVDRNLLRRRGYAVLSRHIDQFPTNIVGAFIFNKKSMDFFGKKSKDKKKNKESNINLENEIKNILRKIN